MNGATYKGRTYQRVPLAERFWAKVTKTDGCWIWTGARSGDGRGKIRHLGETLKAHRVAWELANGQIPDDMRVCHRCDNPACVRPDHLFLGTQSDNVLDMMTKGRGCTGERSGTAKTTAEQAVAMYDAVKNGTSIADVARKFDVPLKRVWEIVRGKKWRHLGLEPLPKRLHYQHHRTRTSKGDAV